MEIIRMSIISMPLFFFGCEKTEEEGACGQDHEKVGWTAVMEDSGEHPFAPDGNATILDDCTIRLDAFTWDALGDETYVWAGFCDDLSTGFAISDQINGETAYENASMDLTLPEGKTLDDLDCIAIYELSIPEAMSWATFGS